MSKNIMVQHVVGGGGGGAPRLRLHVVPAPARFRVPFATHVMLIADVAFVHSELRGHR